MGIINWSKFGGIVAVKDLNLLIWLAQLGISVVTPLAMFILLAVWLQRQWSWGGWTLWVGILLGVYCAVQGFRSSLKTMERFAKDKKEDTPPPAAYNDHD